MGCWGVFLGNFGTAARGSFHMQCWGVLLGNVCIATGEVCGHGKQKHRFALRRLMAVIERERELVAVGERAIVHTRVGRFVCMPPLRASLAQRGLSSSPPCARPQHVWQCWGVLHGNSCQRVSSAAPAPRPPTARSAVLGSTPRQRVLEQRAPPALRRPTAR